MAEDSEEKLILVDVDGTIADPHAPWLDTLNERYHDRLVELGYAPLTHEDISDWNFGPKVAELGLGFKDCVAMLSGLWENESESIPLSDESVPEALEQLLSSYGAVDIVTASKSVDAMETWLGSRNVPSRRVYHGGTDVKLQYKIVVEDNPTLASRLGPGQFLLLHDRPWNRDVADAQNVKRFYTFSELPGLVEGILSGSGSGSGSDAGDAGGPTLTFEPPQFPTLYLSDRPYAMGKSRAAGEDDLIALAQSGAAEEGSWLFAEDGQAWLNARYESVTVPGKSLVNVRLLDLAQLGKFVSSYHIHPQGCIDHQAESLWKQMLSEGAGEMPQEKQAELREVCRSAAVIHAVLPSHLDVDVAASYLQVSGECEADFRIVSPQYITTFTLDRRHPEFGMAVERYTALSRRMLGLIAEHQGNVVDALNDVMAGALTVSVEYRGRPSEE